MPSSPRLRAIACALAAVLGLATAAAADAVPDSLAGALTGLGLENVGVGPDSVPRVGYENRRFRDPTTALGRVARVTGVPFAAVERRMGLPAAAILVAGDSASPHFEIGYPGGSDTPPAPPAGPPRTSRSVDLVFGPVFRYEFGRVLTPFLYRLDLESMLRWSPWPGAMARASIILPGRDGFELDPLHPDVRRIRPGQLSLEQFHWLPGTALTSMSAGYFGDNRYGASAGLARPVASGRVLLDAQADLTGYMAFLDGLEYSEPEVWTGFVGATWHPGFDLSVRGRRAWFLSGDEGVELEVRRAFGDLDIGAWVQRTDGDDQVGLRLALPIPPMTRPTGGRLRVLPIERYHLEYRSNSAPVGLDLGGVPSREEFLRRLDRPSLVANAGRYRAARDGTTLPKSAVGPPTLVSLTGTTGFVNTPWAGVMQDGGLEVGVNHMPARWAYDERGRHDNEAIYATLGFFPRVEISARWTVIPGLRSFEVDVPESRLTDTDYMASGRLAVFEPAPNRPGLALGVDDIRGTRRFHATYAVSGLPWRIQDVQGRIAMGYAFRAFTASRHTLDGVFGAVEVSPWRFVAAQLEYDTEKMNAAIAVPTPFGLRLRAALLHMESFSIGAGFYLPLR